MDTKIKATPKRGLILSEIEPKPERGGDKLIVDLSSHISLCFKLEDGFNPTKYLNKALGQGRDETGNLMYFLFTNKVKPSNNLDLPHCYLVSPNCNFFYGIKVDGAINPLTHTLGEISFRTDRNWVKERENSFPDEEPFVGGEYPRADEAIYRVKSLGHIPKREVILPMLFFPKEYQKVVEVLKKVSKNMQQRGYRRKHYFIMLAARAGELEGIAGNFDASFWYSTITNDIGININPKDGLGGLREAELEIRIQKSREYLSPFFNLKNR